MGADAAMLAVHRYNQIPRLKRAMLNNEGIGLGELLLIMTFQIMLSPELVTDEELKTLTEINEGFEK